jgi:hypothetical protein
VAFLYQQVLSSEVSNLLRSGSAFRGSLFAVALVETIDASSRVHQLLLAGKKRMASRADFNVQITFLG